MRRRPTTPTSPPDPVRLQARRPEDLLALVPYLLGFQPAESLVAVLVRGGRVLLTARLDLPGPGQPSLVGCVQQLVDQHSPSMLVLVAYAADRPRAVEQLRLHLDELVEVAINDALVVDGSRWWSLTCASGCCPAEGRPYEPQSHPFAAEAVYAGLSVWASREAVAAQVAGPAPGDWEPLRRQARELRGPLRRLGSPGRARAMAREVVAALQVLDPDRAPAGERTPDDRPGGLDDRACLRLALLAREVRVRDVACALVTREEAAGHLVLWQRVVSRMPPELAVAPLCLLGVAGWAAGNGTLLNCACTRVETLDPDCSMGQLLADVSARALPPSFWDALSAQLRSDLGLLAG